MVYSLDIKRAVKPPVGTCVRSARRYMSSLCFFVVASSKSRLDQVSVSVE
jgi:hypothetical protein